MEPIDYAGALRRSWRLLVVLGLIGAVVAVLIPVSHPKAKPNPLKWKAAALVGSAPSGGSDLVGGGVTSAQILFYANSQAVKVQTAKDAKLNVPPALLFGYLSASAAPANATVNGAPTTTGAASAAAKKAKGTGLVQLNAAGSTEQKAVSLANYYAYELGYYLTQQVKAHAATNPPKPGVAANPNPATGYAVVQGSIVGTHSAKKAAVTSSHKVRLVAGLVLGLVLGAAIVLLRELLDKHLRTAARAESRFGYPVVAEIPSSAGAGGGSALSLDVDRDPSSAAAEAYRMLRMSVLFEPLASKVAPTNGFGFFNGNGNGNGNGSSLLSPSTVAEVAMTAPIPQVPSLRQIVLVVSAGTEPTRPQVVANLAATYAEAGQRVVVIDTGELEAGRVIEDGASVTGEIRPEDIAAHLEPSRLENAWRLPLRPFIRNTGQLVNRAPVVLDALRSVADAVIIEAPPLLAYHHGEALSHAVDVVLVVGECRLTTFDEAQRAGDLLRRLMAPVLGVVFTNVRLDRRDIRQVPQQGHGSTPTTPAETTNEPAVPTDVGPPVAQTQV
jgi:Mrp family chromosome partitioning ATPase